MAAEILFCCVRLSLSKADTTKKIRANSGTEHQRNEKSRAPEKKLFFKPVIGEGAIAVFAIDLDKSLFDFLFRPLAYPFNLFFLECEFLDSGVIF